MEDKFNLTLEENLFLAKKMLVSSIYSNAKIEGCNVTFPQTQTILDGVNVSTVKLDEIQCIFNLRDAWKYVLNNVKHKLTLDFICKINENVARNESLNWGTLRDGDVLITGTEYVPQIPNKEKVLKDIENINSIDSITKRAIKYMLYGMKSQLFWDGNKRTSIIVANKILIENGKGILIIKDKFLEKFNELLTNYYTTDVSDELEIFLYENCIMGIERNV